MLLDAFAVVEEMRKKHPQHFATLTRVPTTFQRIHSKRLATLTCTEVTAVQNEVATWCQKHLQEGTLVLHLF